LTIPSAVTADPLADAAERFAVDAAHHVMKIRRDDGLYRHLEFRRFAPPRQGEPPRLQSFYWFDLVTWPGHLAIDGDMNGYQFARTEDMFGFFRGNRINPGYWAEKLCGPVTVKEYSEDRFRKIVTEHITEGGEKFPSLVTRWPGLAEAVEREIFTEGAIYHQDGAREALDGFTFGDKHEAECLCGEKRTFAEYEGARLWLASHSGGKGAGHRSKRVGLIEGFRFRDSWEWDFRDWSYQFLWCLHAIQFGIGQYDLAKISPPLAAALSGEETPS
jgi:hypothetical protein